MEHPEKTKEAARYFRCYTPQDRCAIVDFGSDSDRQNLPPIKNF